MPTSHNLACSARGVAANELRQLLEGTGAPAAAGAAEMLGSLTLLSPVRATPSQRHALGSDKARRRPSWVSAAAAPYTLLVASVGASDMRWVHC